MHFSLVLLAILAVFALSVASHGGHGGGGGGHHSGGGGGHHHGGGGHHHHGGHHGGGGGGWHHHHHHHSSYSSPSYGGGSYYGGGGGWGLGRLLFGGLFRRPYYSYYPNYYNYYGNQGYCRVSRFVDYVGSTPRYYCDCPPYPPNYQWNQCIPMNVNYGK